MRRVLEIALIMVSVWGLLMAELYLLLIVIVPIPSPKEGLIWLAAANAAKIAVGIASILAWLYFWKVATELYFWRRVRRRGSAA
ncbi:MAG: hypothetical protein QXJ15_05000 [Candidatus Bathyarchaeia archaeon]